MNENTSRKESENGDTRKLLLMEDRGCDEADGVKGEGKASEAKSEPP